MLALPMLEAQDRLREGGIPDGQVEREVYLATGDYETARRALETRVAAKVKAGQQVDI